MSPVVPGPPLATFLAGGARLAPPQAIPETIFVEASGLSFNTIPPNDFGYWELIDSLIQEEPVGAGDPEILGLLASVGIVKGKPFNPDDRMRKILHDAVEVGNATARTLSVAPRPEEGFAYYPESQWFNMLFVGGYNFLDPPPRSPSKVRSQVRATVPGRSTPGSPSSIPTRALRPPCACSSLASDRSIWSP